MNKIKRTVPKFATEAKESEWWFKNRNIHGKQLLAAVRSGEAKVLTKDGLLERIAASNASKKKTASPVVALRIPQAEEKGLPYQTYIKSLLHETLTSRERLRAG